jgi:hypothetical protein
VAAVKALLATALLTLVCAAPAFADNPTVRISKGDQAKAVAALLRLRDFGAGWAGGPQKPSKLTAPNCPGYDPKESDLTVTGHAQARFTYSPGGVIFEQDTQVLESQQAVATDFRRTVTSKLPGCLEYELKASGKGEVQTVQVNQLSFPHVGNVTAAYRAYVDVHTAGHQAKIVSDFIFFGVGRLEYTLNIVAPAIEGSQLSAFEQAMVQILVARAKGGNVA